MKGHLSRRNENVGTRSVKVCIESAEGKTRTGSAHRAAQHPNASHLAASLSARQAKARRSAEARRPSLALFLISLNTLHLPNLQFILKIFGCDTFTSVLEFFTFKCSRLHFAFDFILEKRRATLALWLCLGKAKRRNARKASVHRSRNGAPSEG